VLTDHSTFLPLALTSAVWRAALLHEHRSALVGHYVSLREKWRTELCPAVDSYNLRGRGARVEWGEEQLRQPTVPFEGPSAVAWTAPDVAQRFSFEPDERVFGGDAGLVEDPVAEHAAFMRRIAWSAEEREEFVRVFWDAPHQFAKVAQAFPGKCTKDIVEMYYLSKWAEPMLIGKERKVRRENKPKRKVTLSAQSRRK
jgi:hypothetical protein